MSDLSELSDDEITELAKKYGREADMRFMKQQSQFEQKQIEKEGFWTLIGMEGLCSLYYHTEGSYDGIRFMMIYPERNSIGPLKRIEFTNALYMSNSEQITPFGAWMIERVFQRFNVKLESK